MNMIDPNTIRIGNIVLDPNPNKKIDQDEDNISLEITGSATLAILGYAPSEVRLNITYSTENHEDILKAVFSDHDLLDSLISGIITSQSSSVNNQEDRQDTVTTIETKAQFDIKRNKQYKEQLKSIIDNNLN